MNDPALIGLYSVILAGHFDEPGEHNHTCFIAAFGLALYLIAETNDPDMLKVGASVFN